METLTKIAAIVSADSGHPSWTVGGSRADFDEYLQMLCDHNGWQSPAASVQEATLLYKQLQQITWPVSVLLTDTHRSLLLFCRASVTSCLWNWCVDWWDSRCDLTMGTSTVTNPFSCVPVFESHGWILSKYQANETEKSQLCNYVQKISGAAS